MNACKFHSLEAQNHHPRGWNRSWARTRIHGTTKKQVWALFTQVERPALQPLPQKPFGLFKVGKRTVHRHGYIEVDRAYYSVPHRFVEQTLTVHYNTVWVKGFWGSQRVAFHRKVEPGRFKTEKAHLPAEKSLSAEEFTQRLPDRCGQTGPQCRLWALKALRVRRQLALRPIQGVLRLNPLGAPPQPIRQLCKPDLLIIDEFGMRNLPSNAAQDLLEIFHRRYHRSSTMIATNRPLEDWGKILGDHAAASAILDRFLEGVHMIRITGRSYRLKNITNNSTTQKSLEKEDQN